MLKAWKFMGLPFPGLRPGVFESIAIVLGGPQQQSIAIPIVPKRGNSNSFSIAIVHFMPVSLALEAYQWPLIVMLPSLQLFCLLCPLQKLRNNIFQTRKKINRNGASYQQQQQQQQLGNPLNNSNRNSNSAKNVNSNSDFNTIDQLCGPLDSSMP